MTVHLSARGVLRQIVFVRKFVSRHLVQMISVGGQPILKDFPVALPGRFLSGPGFSGFR
jgi:hypothetical protein